MKRTISLIVVSLLMCACNSDEEDLDFPIIKGKVFTTSKVEIEVPIDINRDGIYSYDLTQEAPTCFLDPITFQTDNKVVNPAVNDLISLNINYNNNGVAQSQAVACPSPSSIFPNY